MQVRHDRPDSRMYQADRKRVIMKVRELKYSNTNTYLIETGSGHILFDTGWAGTFGAFCRCMGELNIPVQNITHILISHFHPDHMGIAGDIAQTGAKIVVFDVQRNYIHSSDEIFKKQGDLRFKPIDDSDVMFVPVTESRPFLHQIGMEGEVLHTPGHSDDSISLWTDEGYLFVGDLNPLYELELHKETEIGRSWDKLLKLKPKVVYYGHAKTARLKESGGGDAPYGGVQEAKEAYAKDVNPTGKGASETDDDVGVATGTSDLYRIVKQIMHLTDKGVAAEKIRKKTGADAEFIEDVTRMYLTHKDVGVQGILDRIEIKGR